MHHLEFIVSQWKNFYDAIEKQPAIQKYPDELACERVIWAQMGSPFRYCDPPWQPGDDEKAVAERARMEVIWEDQQKKNSGQGEGAHEQPNIELRPTTVEGDR